MPSFRLVYLCTDRLEKPRSFSNGDLILEIGTNHCSWWPSASQSEDCCCHRNCNFIRAPDPAYVNNTRVSIQCMPCKLQLMELPFHFDMLISYKREVKSVRYNISQQLSWLVKILWFLSFCPEFFKSYLLDRHQPVYTVVTPVVLLFYFPVHFGVPQGPIFVPTILGDTPARFGYQPRLGLRPRSLIPI